MSDRIPVNVITGFLGSGKTSLLNHWLRTVKSENILVIENEFGDTNVDAGFLRKASESEIIELTNGCICCSAMNELKYLIENLETMGKRPERILIETTGIADPAPIAYTFWMFEEIRNRYRIENIACLVDAENIEEILYQEEVAQRQILQADTLIVNKTDKVSDEQAQQIKKKVQSINPYAQIHEAVKGNVDFDVLTKRPETGSLPGNMNQTLKHSHYETFTLTMENGLDNQKFSEWMEYVLSSLRNTVFRSKGFVYFSNDPVKYSLQTVMSGYELTEECYWGDEDPKNIITFIGRNINGEFIKEQFHFLHS